jgi:proline dehydrogenase
MSFLDRVVVSLIPMMPKTIVKKISTRYIAGQTITDTIKCIQKLNQDGFCATIDFLGEEITKKSQATDNANEYIRVLEAINQHKLDANISIKPTAMGLLLDEVFCLNTIKSIIEVAKTYDIFVRIDMEDVSCTQKEIDLLLQLKSDYSNVGIAIQAYLKRTYRDMQLMQANNINVRLCKGIYREAPIHLIDNAHNDRSAINLHFVHHAQQAFNTGNYLAMATHDEILVNQLSDLIQNSKVEHNKYEFQMLLRGGLTKLNSPISDKVYSPSQ